MLRVNSLSGFNRRRQAAGGGGGGGGTDLGGGWTLVGEASDRVPVSTSGYSVALPTTAEGDVVVIAVARDNPLLAGGSSVTTSGYTELSSTNATGPAFEYFYKRLTSTPDTSVVFDNSDSASWPMAIVLQVFRGADDSTQIDNGLSDDSGSGNPDPPSHTTVTDGALRIIMGFLDDDDVAASVTAPSGFSNLIAYDADTGSTLGCTVMMATALAPTAGALDPDAFGSTGSDAWRASHFALRPA